MGYYASWIGSIKMKEAPEKSTISDLKYIFDDVYYDSKKKVIELSGHDKYREEDVCVALNLIREITESGEIDYTGEDDSHWRIYFKDGEWEDESGAVYYDSEIHLAQDDKDEFLGRIIDVIQDCLDNKKGEIIEGDWYNQIVKELEAIMRAWKVFS